MSLKGAKSRLVGSCEDLFGKQQVAENAIANDGKMVKPTLTAKAQPLQFIYIYTAMRHAP